MRFLGVLDDILGQKSKVRILRLLLRSHARLTGRQIARQTALKYIEIQRQLTDQIERAILTKDREVAERHTVELIGTEYRNARRQWQALSP